MGEQHLIKLGGLDMRFPYEPYGIQKAMLAKVAVTVTNKEHILLESPTGTGKTLVLLCATLAWQQHSRKIQTPHISNRLKKQLAEKRRKHLESRPCSCGRRQNDEIICEDKDMKGCDKECKGGEKEFKDNVKDMKLSDFMEDEMCKNCQAIKLEIEYQEETGGEVRFKGSTKVPRIYYGTRTHKQIAQVVRELKKTCYSEDLKMNILSSRDRTCVNDDVRDHPDRNDRCQELVKNKTKSTNSKKDIAPDTCRYYKDSNSMVTEFEYIYEKYKGQAWDIEDAVSFGKEHCLCPYYGLRNIEQSAEITFCPYNYLLDGNIRKAMNINLSNAVIILDEAHNIEDICRDSASFVIDTQQIEEIVSTINKAAPNYIQGSLIRDAYDYFKNLFVDMKSFLIRFNFESSKSQVDGNCLARHVMTHQEMLIALDMINLGPGSLKTVKENLSALRGDEEDSSDKGSSKSQEAQELALSNNQMQFITQLAITLDFMHSSNGKYCHDFRGIVSKHLDKIKPAFNNRTQNRVTNGDVHLFQLSLLCMNPGIAFEKIHTLAWSVIVASGTLSPIESLKTELGCHFAQVFEGSHVIDDDRIYATVLSRGPKNVDLNFRYANSLRLDVQDEIGTVLRDVCMSVPNGVLVFFPSYDRMENLYQRWFAKGLMADVQRAGKKLFRENKNFTAAKFEEELKKYHHNAKNKGALLFAVFRGKVSEGIDFSDAAARAVITIGIPYPNMKEITVSLKKDYNDLARRERPQLMNGGDWYASQAFRALNQALGRCIRHKQDWGAIIMIDSRLRERSSVNNISKWIRRVVTAPNDYASLTESLNNFVQKRTSAPPSVEEPEHILIELD